MVAGVDGSRYAAFISYSHKDAAAARALHGRLERYRIPKRLVGRPGDHGPVPARLTPIFRDRDELPAAGDLSEKVRAALAASDSLVVVCSPHSAASEWVAREIMLFRELHPDRPILAAVIAGEPGECFPKELGGTGASGAPIEPLAADLRKAGDGRRLGFLKLVAGLTGVGLDALVQRDAARAIRRVTAVTLTALAATLVMAVLTVIALNARREAERQRAGAEGLVEFMLTDLRDRLKGAVRLDVLTDVNQRALDHYAQQDLSTLSTEALERRARILHAMGEDDLARNMLERAQRQFAEAARTTAALLAADPDNPERLFEHIQSEYWIGRVAEKRGEFGTALAAYRRYLDQAERLNRLAPGNPKYAGELAYAESNLGTVRLTMNRPAEARGHFERALVHFTAVSRLEPGKPLWISKIGNSHAWIADCWFAEKRYAEARAARLTERGIKQSLLDRDPKNLAYRYGLVVTGRALALIDAAERNYGAAERTLLGLRITIAAMLATDPDNRVWGDQAAMIEADLAEIYQLTGRIAAGRAAIARARARFAGDGGPIEPSASRTRLEQRIKSISNQLERSTSPAERIKT